MAKHTPGPWVYIGGSDKRLSPYIRVEGDEPGTCAVAMVCSRGSLSTIEANARLIAAAPTLLAALRALVFVGERELADPEDCGALHAAKDAIAKATAPIDSTKEAA